MDALLKTGPCSSKRVGRLLYSLRALKNPEFMAVYQSTDLHSAIVKCVGRAPNPEAEKVWQRLQEGGAGGDSTKENAPEAVGEGEGKNQPVFGKEEGAASLQQGREGQPGGGLILQQRKAEQGMGGRPPSNVPKMPRKISAVLHPEPFFCVNRKKEKGSIVVKASASVQLSEIPNKGEGSVRERGVSHKEDEQNETEEVLQGTFNIEGVKSAERETP